VTAETLVAGPARGLAGILGAGWTPAEPLPLLWHWVYLLERPATAALGADGHPVAGIPAPPGEGMRRMFGGGVVEAHRPLYTGREASRHSEIVDRREKQGRSGPLTFVTVQHSITQDGETAVVDLQDIVYLPDRTGPSTPKPPPTGPAPASKSSPTPPATAPGPSPTPPASVTEPTPTPPASATEPTPTPAASATRSAPPSPAAGPSSAQAAPSRFKPTQAASTRAASSTGRSSAEAEAGRDAWVTGGWQPEPPTTRTLFQFSALTYNAHRIHYDREYARSEGYPGLLVHGPLQALLMAELARRSWRPASEYSYRLVAPLYDDQGLVVSAVPDGDAVRVSCRDATGRLTATGTLREEPGIT
jgi:hydroxyacyl-ACP dehydratase HTD2-like protein with hotdog domain